MGSRRLPALVMATPGSAGRPVDGAWAYGEAGAWGAVRTADRRAQAQRARVMCRYSPVARRTSYSSRVTAPLAVSKQLSPHPRRVWVGACRLPSAQHALRLTLGYQERGKQQTDKHDPTPGRQAPIRARWLLGGWRWRKFCLALPANFLVVRIMLTACGTIHRLIHF